MRIFLSNNSKDNEEAINWSVSLTFSSYSFFFILLGFLDKDYEYLIKSLL